MLTVDVSRTALTSHPEIHPVARLRNDPPVPRAELPVVPTTPAEVANTGEPYFMEDALCRVAVGRWRLDDENLHGFVTLDARAAGVANVKEKPQAGPVSWECDANRGELIVKYGGGVSQKLRAAGDEKLMFGYDQNDLPVVYNR